MKVPVLMFSPFPNIQVTDWRKSSQSGSGNDCVELAVFEGRS